jgi:DNA-binding transcriptional regulator YiaG
MGRSLCGEPLRFYEWPGGPAVLDVLTCARRAGHGSPRHRSAAAMAAARRKAAAQAPTGSPVVAAVIRQAREQAAMSRPRLAAVVGVTATAVQWWEQGKRTPERGVVGAAPADAWTPGRC